MAKEQSFEVFSGNDVVLHVTVIDEDTGDPIDLTTYSNAIWALAKKPNSSTPLIQKILSDGITFITPVQGKLDVILSAANLEPLKGEYYHEMRLTDASGKKVTTLYGTVTIQENLIRD
jgi:hypothetical protein